MNLSKILGKNTFFLTVAAVAALASASASAGNGVVGVKPSVAPLAPPQPFANVQITNQQQNSCARFYIPAKDFGGRYEPARQYDLGTMKHTRIVLETDKPVMASVFNGKTCGQAAARNVWFTPRAQAPGQRGNLEYFTVTEPKR